MQNPPKWNTHPSSRPFNWAVAAIIGCAVVPAVLIILCAAGGLLLWRNGGGDLLACSDLTMKGEYKRAIPLCRSLVAKLPRSGEGHNNLAWCLSLDGQVPESLIEARKAVQLEPTRNTYDTLAMALALSGESKEALQVETEHVLINGQVGDASEHVTLGMVYYAGGRKEEAREEWEIARTSKDPLAQKLATEFEAKYH